MNSSANTALAVPTGFNPEVILAVEKLASTVANSALIPSDLRGKAGDVMIIMLTGHELGLPPMLALQKVYVIKGRPFVGSELLAAKVQASPACEYFTLMESTDKRATYETRRRGSPKPVSITYTFEEAQKAGLTGKDNWKNHAPAMLRARAAASLARAVYPDLILGFDAMAEVELEEERFQAARRVEARPAATTTPEPTDAELVQEGPSQEEIEEQALAFWRDRFYEATTLADLEKVSAELARTKPAGRVRDELIRLYGERKAQLASGDAA